MREFRNRVFERYSSRKKSRGEIWSSWIKKVLLLVMVAALFYYLGLGKGLRSFFWGEPRQNTTEVRNP